MYRRFDGLLCERIRICEKEERSDQGTFPVRWEDIVAVPVYKGKGSCFEVSEPQTHIPNQLFLPKYLKMLVTIESK